MPATAARVTRTGGDESADVLSKAVKALASLAKVAQRADRLREGGDVSGLHVAIENLVHGLAALSELAEPMHQLERETAAREEQVILELESRVKESFAQHGWRLDGVWPNLYVERAIPLNVDAVKKVSVIGTRRLPSIAVNDLVQAIQPMIKELIPKDFSPAKFLAELAAAYDSVASRGQLQAQIFDVYQALVIRGQGGRFWRDARSSDFEGMTAEQFRARLSQILGEGGAKSPDGRSLRLLPPLNASDGLYLYQPAEARFGFVGRIEFVQEQESAL